MVWPPTVPESIRREFIGGTPLWYYILREAEVRREGDKLGPVGGHIVAEVIINLIREDPTSYLGKQPSWKPTLPQQSSGNFRMADLIAFTQGA
jgi:hypothetical protein